MPNTTSTNSYIGVNASGYKLKSEDQQLAKARHQDAALDIASAIDCVVPARGRTLISTGLYIAIPEGHVGLIWSRSGLAVKHGISTGAGCVDNSYRGEVKVLLFNHSDDDFNINKGDRIAQLLTVPINLNLYQEVNSLDETSRGEKGFGSSGLTQL